MRILLLNQFYPPDTAATGQLLADVAAGLAGRGHEVHVVCSAGAYGGKSGVPAKRTECRDEDTIPLDPSLGETSPDASRHPRKGGVVVHRVRASGFGRGHAAGRLADYGTFYALALMRALRLPRMDLCLALTTPPFIGLVGVALRLLRGTRLVLWSMDLYPEVLSVLGGMSRSAPSYRLLARIARGLYGRCAAVVSLGGAMTERLAEAGVARGRIITVHNWVPGEAVAPMSAEDCQTRRDWAVAPGRVVAMYSGNIGMGHELQSFVQAAAALGDAPLDLVFAGTGAGRAPLEAMTRDLGLKHVRFLDPAPLDRLRDRLDAGDIHLVSQKPGTQGLLVPSKIYGILAAGRPAVFVGPEDCEVTEILRESGGGIVVAPGDVAGTAAALRRLAEDGMLRAEMGKQARAYYEARFGRDRSVGRIMEVLETVGNSGHV